MSGNLDFDHEGKLDPVEQIMISQVSRFSDILNISVL